MVCAGTGYVLLVIAALVSCIDTTGGLPGSLHASMSGPPSVQQWAISLNLTSGLFSVTASSELVTLTIAMVIADLSAVHAAETSKPLGCSVMGIGMVPNWLRYICNARPVVSKLVEVGLTLTQPRTLIVWA